MPPAAPASPPDDGTRLVAVVRAEDGTADDELLGPGLVVRPAVLHDGALTVLPGPAVVPDEPALAALRALPAPEHQVAGHAMHAFSTTDDLAATRVLVLEDLLASVGEPEAPHGTLVALPDPRALLVHVVRDEEVLRAAHLMATVARMRQTEAGAISPEVFHRSPDGTLQQVTRHADDEVEVHVEGSLADALTSLGLVDRSRRARRAAARRRRG
ncbi:hypothetical protein KIN34_08625 [Cellulomonas sp. DKR-3]|uniref:Uncharacterized protein n=1 Tax=Cellulomonas fulva TaxID=2835530 RepID=A0ABS5TYW9_9CELL|nr:hypothetical protein [Cellulomonas fulva]MBT0994348.1 hypothetical protein [Cellulomonas fulva]